MRLVFACFSVVALLACGGPIEDAVQKNNQAPVAYDQKLIALEGGAARGAVRAQDADGDAVVFEIVQAPGHATVQLDPHTGSFEYTPEASWRGLDQFSFTARDAHARSNIAHVVVLTASQGEDDNYIIAGVASYDRVPVVCEANSCRLAYTQVSKSAIAGATVQIVDGDAVLASAQTDTHGYFSVHVPPRAQATVVVLCESQTPPIVVTDNTRDQAVYALWHPIDKLSAINLVTVHAASGHDGVRYTAPRAAAPFAILDAAFTAASRLLQEREVDLPPLVVNWSVKNRPVCCDLPSGRIGTTHWDGQQLYVLGQADVDTDEFDVHVLTHEWAHYFESMVGRSDTPGGSHGLGDVLEPRVAFAEGLGNALSAMVRYPDTRYADTMGAGERQGFWFDLDDNTLSLQGWYSESSVGALIFDLFDPRDSADNDDFALGFGPIFDVLMSHQTSTPALTSLFSFFEGLWLRLPQSRAQLDVLLARHGIDPIVDAYGSLEDDSGGVAAALPLYRSLAFEVPQEIAFAGSTTPWANYNKLAANRFFVLQGIEARVRIEVDAASDVDVYVYQNGRIVASAQAPCYQTECHEEVVFASTEAVYILNVQSYDAQGRDFTARLWMTAHD